MSGSFALDLGPFSLRVDLDDRGILVSRKTLARSETQSIPWDKIAGATLLRPAAADLELLQDEERMAQFLGPEAVAKFHEFAGKVGQIFVAYRDEKNRLRQTDLPAPLADAAYFEEFQARLGARWLGESKDRRQVEKRLKMNAGFFKTIFILVALLGMVAVVCGVAFLGLLGPVLNFMSIQKMLLDWQDGNYMGLGYRLVSYVALLGLGYWLHRLIRSRLDAMRRPRSSRVFL